MAPGIHCVPPLINICSHNHVHPQSCSTSRNNSGRGAFGASRAVDVTWKTPGWISSTNHMFPFSIRRLVEVCVNWFSFFALLEYTSIISESGPKWRSLFVSKRQCQGWILWVSAMYSLMLCTRILIGQISSSASFQIRKSASVNAVSLLFNLGAA
jgi:hypothetical protein